MHTHLGTLPTRHVVIPAAVVAALLAAYYAGGPTLAALVAPAINRELGLLEHLEAAVLATMVVLGARAAWTAAGGTAARRWGIVVAVAAAALLAEELDYGRHHLGLLLGDPAVWTDAPPALHNRAAGDGHQVVDYVKKAANVGLALWFVLAALIWGNARRPGGRVAALVRRVGLGVPNPWYAATVGLYVAVSQVAHALQASAERHGVGWRPLDGNVSEFEELVVYYLLALYAADVLHRNGRDDTAPAAAAGESRSHAAGVVAGQGLRLSR